VGEVIDVDEEDAANQNPQHAWNCFLFRGDTAAGQGLMFLAEVMPSQKGFEPGSESR